MRHTLLMSALLHSSTTPQVHQRTQLLQRLVAPMLWLSMKVARVCMQGGSLGGGGLTAGLLLLLCIMFYCTWIVGIDVDGMMQAGNLLEYVWLDYMYFTCMKIG